MNHDSISPFEQIIHDEDSLVRVLADQPIYHFSNDLELDEVKTIEKQSIEPKVTTPEVPKASLETVVDAAKPQPTVNKELIELLILAKVDQGATTPESAREFLRKMVIATKIPGSKMRFKEVSDPVGMFKVLEHFDATKTLVFGEFGLTDAEDGIPVLQQVEGKQCIVSGSMVELANDVPRKRILWELMKSYFNL